MENEIEIGIVVSSYHHNITDRLLTETIKQLKELEVDEDMIDIVEVPGALEIPLMAKQLAGLNDAVICLGAVIRGETSHYDLVCQESARCLSNISLEANIPVINGILTVDTMQQAEERIGRGAYCADAAIRMIDLMHDYEEIDETLLNALQNIQSDFESN
jgi:6,7-dimethyl-8-ribityllumazine synthase